MARYMLDTDTCSYIMKRSHPTVLKRLQAIPVTDVSISVISLGGHPKPAIDRQLKTGHSR
jgi:predicted nucleic acid-binding protein